MQMEREKCLEIYLYLKAQIESILMSTCLRQQRQQWAQQIIRLINIVKNVTMPDTDHSPM